MRKQIIIYFIYCGPTDKHGTQTDVCHCVYTHFYCFYITGKLSAEWALLSHICNIFVLWLFLYHLDCF